MERKATPKEVKDMLNDCGCTICEKALKGIFISANEGA